MRIALVRSGGVAGIPRKTIVETKKGTARETEIRNLIKSANLPQYTEATLRTGPDRLRYTLTVEDGDTVHSVTFDEERTPEQFRPLMEAILRDAPPDEPEASKA